VKMLGEQIPSINRKSKGKLRNLLPARTAIRIVRSLLRLFQSPLVWRSCSHTGGRGKSTLIFDSLHRRHEADES
jgi:hypothetical protein